MDVAEAIGPSCDKTIVGIRPGEKIHEEMIMQQKYANEAKNQAQKQMIRNQKEESRDLRKQEMAMKR